jgi:hypothetical protein
VRSILQMRKPTVGDFRNFQFSTLFLSHLFLFLHQPQTGIEDKDHAHQWGCRNCGRAAANSKPSDSYSGSDQNPRTYFNLQTTSLTSEINIEPILAADSSFSGA